MRPEGPREALLMESTTRTPLHERDLAVRQALRDLTDEQRCQLDCHAAIRGLTSEQLVVLVVTDRLKAEDLNVCL